MLLILIIATKARVIIQKLSITIFQSNCILHCFCVELVPESKIFRSTRSTYTNFFTYIINSTLLAMTEVMCIYENLLLSNNWCWSYGNPCEHQFKNWLLYFQNSSLLLHQGKQQKMAKILGPCKKLGSSQHQPLHATW